MAKEISHKNKNLRGEKNSAESKLRRSILIFSKEQRLKLVEINNQLIVQNRNLRRCEQELLAKEMKKKPEQVQRFINNLRAGLYPRLCQKVLVFKSYEEKNNLFANLDYFTTPKNMANLMRYLSSGQEKDLDKLGPTEEPVPLEGEIYKCGLCSKMYRSAQDVETHRKNLHKHPGPTFQIRPGPGYFSRASLS